MTDEVATVKRSGPDWADFRSSFFLFLAGALILVYAYSLIRNGYWYISLVLFPGPLIFLLGAYGLYRSLFCPEDDEEDDEDVDALEDESA